MARQNRKRNRRTPKPAAKPAPETIVELPPVERVESVAAANGQSDERANRQSEGQSDKPEREPVTDQLDQIVAILGEFEGRLTSRLDDLVATPPVQSPPSIVSPDVQHLEDQLHAERMRSHELQSQNESLASQLANANVQRTVGSSDGMDESMSWEDRKRAVLLQMENDEFDPEVFLQSLSESEQQVVNPSGTCWTQQPGPFLESLIDRLVDAERILTDRSEEIRELQMLLQNRADNANDNIAIGAAAIASMVDSDELVMQEREHLAQLKTQWEDKFRAAEIEVSLERAKLSRERQEIARRSQELEEQLERLQRDKRDSTDQQPAGRRWLAELGLGNDNN